MGGVPLVNVVKNLFESDCPDHEEEPISNNQLPFAFQLKSVGVFVGYIGYWTPVRPVLFQIF